MTFGQELRSVRDGAHSPLESFQTRHIICDLEILVPIHEFSLEELKELLIRAAQTPDIGYVHLHVRYGTADEIGSRFARLFLLLGEQGFGTAQVGVEKDDSGTGYVVSAALFSRGDLEPKR